MVDMDLLAWVVRGPRRIAVITALNRPMTPTMLRKESLRFNRKISRNNASDIIRDLARKGLAVCLNPEARMGRLYQLTADGHRTRRIVAKWAPDTANPAQA